MSKQTHELVSRSACLRSGPWRCPKHGREVLLSEMLGLYDRTWMAFSDIRVGRAIVSPGVMI